MGAIIASEERLCEIEKFLDTNTICPNKIAQYAALWGLQNLREWLDGERLEILSRCDVIEREMASAPKGWTLLGAGAYFAYLRHDFALSSEELVLSLLAKEAVLTLPGTMFGRTLQEGGNGQGEKTLRVAFANADKETLSDMFTRLRNFRP